jgi:hypothetical protein
MHFSEHRDDVNINRKTSKEKKKVKKESLEIYVLMYKIFWLDLFLSITMVH